MTIERILTWHWKSIILILLWFLGILGYLIDCSCWTILDEDDQQNLTIHQQFSNRLSIAIFKLATKSIKIQKKIKVDSWKPRNDWQTIKQANFLLLVIAIVVSFLRAYSESKDSINLEHFLLSDWTIHNQTTKNRTDLFH